MNIKCQHLFPNTVIAIDHIVLKKYALVAVKLLSSGYIRPGVMQALQGDQTGLNFRANFSGMVAQL